MKRLGLFVACLAACAAPDRAAEIIRHDSAGIEIVTVPVDAFVALPKWTIDTGTRLFTIGGEDPDQDVDRIGWAVKLDDGKILLAKSGPFEIRLHDSDGRFLRRVARGGAGPGEFSYAWTYRVREDSLLLWDINLGRLTHMQTDGTVLRVTDLNSLPRSMIRGAGGSFADGALALMPLGWYEDSNLARFDGERVIMPIYRVDVDRMSVDTQPGYPGLRIYQGQYTEGGHTSSGPAAFELDGPTVILVTDSGMTVALPDSAEILLRRADGSLHRRTTIPLSGRPVTPEFRELYITSESTRVATNPYGKDYLTNLRRARYPDRLPLFERIHPGPDGEVWLERYWISADSSRDYVALDGTGAPVATLSLPMRRTLRWIGKDIVLATWRDEDDVTYLSAFPLHRTPTH